MKPTQETRVINNGGAAHRLKSQGEFEFAEPVETKCGLTMSVYTLWLRGTAPRNECGNCAKGA